MNHQPLLARVERMMQRLERMDVCMHGFILSVDGQIKATGRYANFHERKPHRMYSISKSMTALAIGMLMDEGKLRMEDCVASFFPDYLPAEPPRELMELRIADMLRMATCYRRTTYREGIDENWAATFFTATPSHAPGSVFHYDTSCSQVLAALVKRLSGQEVIDFLNERLLAPIGADDEKYWLRDPSGCCQGGTGLCMSLRDLHRVALLVMNGGEGIVPEWFCRGMGEKHIDTSLQPFDDERYGYGWQCWRARSGFVMYGMGGQLAFIDPDKRAVLCTTANTRLSAFGVSRIHDAYFEEVYPYLGVEDMEPAVLYGRIPALVNHPEFAMPASGVYRFASNPLGLRSVRLDGSTLMLDNARGLHPLCFGLGEYVTADFPGWERQPAMSCGGWRSEGVLHVRSYIENDAPCGVELLLCFQRERLTVQARRANDPLTEGYDGVATGWLEGTR